MQDKHRVHRTFQTLRIFGETVDLIQKNSFDEILLKLTHADLPSQSISSKKVLFWGERVGKISSYTAGWLAGRGMDVIVLDGANRFDPYMVSSFARKALIPPERLLKKIRIARAFTCYQMATLMERLIFLVGAIRELPLKKIQVILLGPLTTFLDEDVPEREVRPLFERALRKAGEMVVEGVPFFVFQSPVSPGSKRVSLMKRLSQFSDLAWRISLEGQEPKVVLEKGLETSAILRKKHQIPSTNTPIITNLQ